MSRRDRARASEAREVRPGRARTTAIFAAATAFFALAVALGACGTGAGPDDDGGGTATTAPGGSLVHPTGENEVVLRISEGGGFVPVEYNYTMVPEFSLYGDGRVIVSGPVIAIYPGPALPNLQTAIIPEEAVQAILSAVREAGLFDPTFEYGQPSITDVPTATFTVNAGGAGYRSDVYALGMEAGTNGLSLEQQQARAALNDLRGRLIDLTDFVSGEITWTQYEYSALAVYSQAVDPGAMTDPTDVQPGRLDWPLGDLNTLGEEVPAGFRRVVVSGQDLATLRLLLEKATAITLWTSDDREYHLFFRPLLPDETS
ncbi:MAG: hypothetical protein V1912_06290 [bacterium]